MPKQVDLDKAIRKVKDFPKPGILFYDITGIISDPEAFQFCIDEMVRIYKDKHLTAVASIEARGFLFAAPFALRMGIPLILVRKKGKLPGETYEKKFSLEYGEDVIQIHKSDLHAGDNILIMDDLIATGGTVKAAADIIEEAGATVADIFCVIGLPFLPYENVLSGYNVTTLINYDSE
jgi:adenine phosphoribosyltransferase